MWEITASEEFKNWYQDLTEDQARALDARIDMLSNVGPSLGRPTVDRIERSRHHNMKELRCSKNGSLRVLFLFDPNQQVVLLLGGNKAIEGWTSWYREAIEHADNLYDQYLEGLIERI